MKRFEDYTPHPGSSFAYSGKKVAYADELVFKFVGETAVRIAGVQTGEFQFGYDIPLDQYGILETNPDIQMFMVSPNMQGFVIVNKGAPPFDNLYTRQALQHAIKLDELATAAIGDSKFWFLVQRNINSAFPFGNS